MSDDPAPAGSYEVVVVGAGPAGAAAAALLGRRGHSVLLVDRASFPRPKLCTHAIMPAGLPVLDELGVLPTLEEAGAQRWYGVRLWLNGHEFAERLPRSRVAFPYGLSIRRERLDLELLAAARREPCVDVLTGARVESVQVRGGRVVGVRISSGRAAVQIASSFVVLAGGRTSALARGLGLRQVAWPNRHTAYVAYLDGVPAEPEPCLEGFYRDGLSASLLPADNGLRAGGIMAAPGAWRPGTWAERLLRELRYFPPLRDRLHDARLVSAPISVGRLRNVWRGRAPLGLLLAGDAATQTDPLFGQGISWALRSARWAADAISTGLATGNPRLAAERYDRRRQRTFGPRFVAMSAVSQLPPGSRLERLIIANAAVNPPSTRLFLRAILGFGTVSRRRTPRRGLGTWVREAVRAAPPPRRG